MKLMRVIFFCSLVIFFQLFSPTVYAQEDFSDPGTQDITSEVTGCSGCSSSDFSADTSFTDVSVDNSGSYSIDGNSVSFSSDVNIESNNVGFTYSTGFHAYSGPNGGIQVDGPAGTVGQVTENPDGSFTVSFETPTGSESTSAGESLVVGGDITGSPSDPSSSGDDTVTITAPDPDPTSPYIEGTPPALAATTVCLGSRPLVDLQIIPPPVSPGVVYNWRILKSETQGTYVDLPSSQYTFRDGDSPTKIVAPSTIYFYRAYGYRSGLRTPLSNILLVLSPSCAPVVSTVCPNTNPGTIQNFNVSWSYDPTATGYKLYRGTNGSTSSRVLLSPKYTNNIVSRTETNLTEGTSYNYWVASYKTLYSAPWTEITSTDENGNPTGTIDHPGYFYDVDSPFSGMSPGKTPLACDSIVPPVDPSPPVLVTPAVTLTITTPTGTFPNGALPVIVRQDDPVTINWQITNATSANATSNPANPGWNGPVNPVSGSQTISTSTVGNYVLTLSGINGALTSSSSVQLNIKPKADPYIQTTGGDVHTNSGIRVPNQ